MIIRNYKTADSRAIADLFHAAVHAIASTDYSAAQCEAWAPTPPNYAAWQLRLAQRQPFVAEQDDVILGFIELEPDGHIDCLYVHPEHQRRGIAGRLLRHLLQQARILGITQLHVEASRPARPFFAAHGFELQAQNSVVRRGQTLINYRMVRMPGAE
ncbi:GNAT family N-acetyltransferase [Marinobacterium sedimentorum]|uniref:GNAT family N-acetyltransferase n=1 Tax=Marinobacterium sedimentorum TaxID=2927804 RepID=UPI0020C6CEE4|nr:GNAT family N-acetyltransferase [Marinobacterium sedimentorum]MCP8690147.1 GNAT family N-acetyltransferase [Marinobacterium sedimentorum]